jgi:hypothetical protein
MEALYTLRALQRAHFKSTKLHVLKYAIAEAGIEPAMRAGIVRLFGDKQLPEITAAVHRTSRAAKPHSVGA